MTIFEWYYRSMGACIAMLLVDLREQGMIR
jgi:hypothetical protein